MTQDSDIPVRHIFRWDLDKTYLKTDFDTVRDLIRTAMQKPEDKINVPGAVSLMRELMKSNDEGRTMITFVSGSPTQMRAKLEEKFALDGIRPDVFVLKPTLQNILRGRFKAVRGQVGYKLSALFELRPQTPLADETMFGDDAEQDAFIYSLYADVSSGAIDLQGLTRILEVAEVYPISIERILAAAENLEVRDTVRRIFINLERRSPPGRFWTFGPRITPIVNYFQAALILLADGTIDEPAVLRVAAGMVQRHGYGLLDFSNSFQDLIRRSHLNVGHIDQLTHHLDTHPEDEAILTGGMARRLLDRVRALAPRNIPPQREWIGPPDYLEILAADRALKKAVSEKRPGLFER